MNFFRTTAGILVSLLLLSGCASEPQVTPDQYRYPDLKGLIAAQLPGLAGKSLRKTATIEGNTQSWTQSPQDWQKELQVFADADLNRSSLLGLYTETIQQTDSSEIRTFIAQKSDFRVRKMHFESKEGRPLHIAIEYEETNLLYTNRRQMHLHWTDGRLSSYELEGFRKLSLQDTAQYVIRAVVE